MPLSDATSDSNPSSLACAVTIVSVPKFNILLSSTRDLGTSLSTRSRLKGNRLVADHLALICLLVST